MPLLETKGAASAQGFGGAGAGASGPVTYIEDVFSTYLYTGNGSTQTITNGIDLSTKGGLVWIKPRNQAQDHIIFDTVGGITKSLTTNNTAAQYTATAGNEGLASFNNNGFTAKLFQNSTGINNSACNNASWTFREQPKFFDIVTYTGNGANRTISHNLGSEPGCIIVKRTDAAADWQVYHRSMANTAYLVLNSTGGLAIGTTRWNSTTPTSTVFSLGTDTTVNASGGTYVAYLFAHDAGGFGLSGTDNVISCGSYSGNGSSTTGNTISLGYEPQWVMIKRADTNDFIGWCMYDNMRGFSMTDDQLLRANTSGAELTYNDGNPTATGFTVLAGGSGGVNVSGGAYIYIAIRRGPMKTPTTGTSVYNAITRTGTGAAATVTGVGFPSDLVVNANRNVASRWKYFVDRLRGAQRYLASNATDQEYTQSTFPNGMLEFLQDGMSLGADTSGTFNVSGDNNVAHFFRRAPGFFDEVCYTGTGSATTQAHSLGVAPELMITRRRDSVAGWTVYSVTLGADKYLRLHNDGTATTSSTAWNNTTPTTAVFSVGTESNANTALYVAYLFATCPGVSKVGSYTGNGSSQTINCGFTGGARFVLIKRTDSTGDWYVWDTARGIVAGNDPHLSLNSTAAEVTTNDSIDTDSTGFIVNQLAATNINVSSATYIYLAIA